MPCGQTNSWIGASSGNWNDSPDNWSLGQIPGPCDNVLIGFGNTIHVLDDECALGETLTISTGSILEVDDGAIMQIKYPQATNHGANPRSIVIIHRQEYMQFFGINISFDWKLIP